MAGVREILSKNPAIAIAAIVVIVVVLVMFLWRGKPEAESRLQARAFFYDVETKEVLIRKADEIPPLMGKSGKPTVARAVFYTEGGNSEKKLGYLEQYTEEAQAALRERVQGERGPADVSGGGPADDGRRVRAPEDGSEWVPASSVRGQAVMNRMYEGVADRSRIRIVTPE